MTPPPPPPPPPTPTTTPDSDRLTTLRRELAVLDAVYTRAEQRIGRPDPWRQAWAEIHSECLLAIGVEEQRARAEAAGETGGTGP